MERKEDTPARIIRRKYEEKHKEQRKAASKVIGTSVDRKMAEEIEAFLEEKNISKVELIVTGYLALKEKYSKTK